MSDAVAQAIDALASRAQAVPQRPPEQRNSGSIRLSSGRIVGINLPAGLSDSEFLELLVILATQVRAQSRTTGPASRLVVPR